MLFPVDFVPWSGTSAQTVLDRCAVRSGFPPSAFKPLQAGSSMFPQTWLHSVRQVWKHWDIPSEQFPPKRWRAGRPAYRQVDGSHQTVLDRCAVRSGFPAFRVQAFPGGILNVSANLASLRSPSLETLGQTTEKWLFYQTRSSQFWTLRVIKQ
jgi:hypothetical protein